MDPFVALVLALGTKLVNAPKQPVESHEAIYLSLTIVSVCLLMTLLNSIKLKQSLSQTAQELATLKSDCENWKKGKPAPQACVEMETAVQKMIILWDRQFGGKWRNYLMNSHVAATQNPNDFLDKPEK